MDIIHCSAQENEEMSEFVCPLEADVKMLKRIVVEGNGKAALTDRMTAVEIPMNEIKWVGRSVLGALIGLIIAVLTGHLK